MTKNTDTEGTKQEQAEKALEELREEMEILGDAVEFNNADDGITAIGNIRNNLVALEEFFQ